DYDILGKIGDGEEFLRSRFKGNVRLRLHKDIVRIEVDQDSFDCVLKDREAVISYLKELGFAYITLDLEGFRSGSMDVGIE
ncbi:MAG: asparagine synthase, partial [Lacrimispora sp.]|nr:asparagine synthase [Lacrimispora sp.]